MRWHVFLGAGQFLQNCRYRRQMPGCQSDSDFEDLMPGEREARAGYLLHRSVWLLLHHAGLVSIQTIACQGACSRFCGSGGCVPRFMALESGALQPTAHRRGVGLVRRRHGSLSSRTPRCMTKYPLHVALRTVIHGSPLGHRETVRSWKHIFLSHILWNRKPTLRRERAFGEPWLSDPNVPGLFTHTCLNCCM